MIASDEMPQRIEHHRHESLLDIKTLVSFALVEVPMLSPCARPGANSAKEKKQQLNPDNILS